MTARRQHPAQTIALAAPASCLALLLAVCFLAGCGDGRQGELAPAAVGQLSLTPDVLPYEGGTVQLDWQSTPSGAYVRDSVNDFNTSGVQVAVGQNIHGGVETFELYHPLERWPLHSASLTSRPQWQKPEAVALATSSRILAAEVTSSGQLLVVGETEAAQAGAAMGSTDLFLYRYSPNGRLIEQQQLGGPLHDRLVALRSIEDELHLVFGSTAAATGYATAETTFRYVRIHAQGVQPARPVACLDRLNRVLDWQILPDRSILALATGSTPSPRLHALHCGQASDDFKRQSSSSIPFNGTATSAILLQGSTPQAALLAITTNADLGAGSAAHPQPQVVRIDIPSNHWQARRLASTERHRWLAGFVRDDTIELVGSTHRSGADSRDEFPALPGQAWLLRAPAEGPLGPPSLLFDGEEKTPCCVAYQRQRGPKPSAWIVGSAGMPLAPGSAEPTPAWPELTAVMLPERDPLGRIELRDSAYTSQLLSAVATDASGDFYTISTAFKADQSRWLRIEQFNEYGESRVPQPFQASQEADQPEPQPPLAAQNQQHSRTPEAGSANNP